MSATTSSVAPSVQVERVTQVRVLRSEWVKMRSLRSTTFTLLAAVVAMNLLAGVGGAVFNARWQHLDPIERLRFNPIDHSLRGVVLAQLAVGVLGVLLISGEYATGMVRSTLAAVPTRLPVLWAKTALYAVTIAVLMFAASLAAFLVGQHFLQTHGTTLGAAHAWESIFGIAGYLTAIGVLAVALGFIIRSTAGGIATLFGVLLVLPGLGSLLPTSWQDHTIPYLPSQAGEAIYAANPDPSLLSPGHGVLVLVIWMAVALAGAAYALKTRDV
ncbi:MAG: transporter permease [Marmoricola sp.]|nr:transporter permease [Marmoricola sp.]